MTTARRSWPNSSPVALAAGLTILAIAAPSAHRLDEYLQTARVAIDPGRVQIDLDLTPGVAVARGILAEIDRDRNGSVGAGEGQAYAERVLREIHLEVDGWPLPIELAGRSFPAMPAMLGGEGSIQLHLTATLPLLAAGTHRVLYRNAHHPDIGVYLANALMPASPRVTVLTQTRDVGQRELVIEYALSDERPRPWWLPVVLAAAVGMTAGVLWRWSRSR